MRKLFLVLAIIAGIIFGATVVGSGQVFPVQSNDQNEQMNMLLSVIQAVTGIISITGLPLLIARPQDRRLTREIPITEYLNNLKIRNKNHISPIKIVDLQFLEQVSRFREVGRRLDLSIPNEFSGISPLLRAHKKFVLVGDPGSGKSTVLRQIATKLCDKFIQKPESRIPFWIDLSDSNNPADPEELIRYWWSKERLEPDIEPLLKNGRLFLLLDGLNEMPDGQGVNSFTNRVRLLRGFLDDYIGKVIVTCRVADYNNTLQLRLPEIKIMKLGAHEIRAFADKQLNARAQEFVRLVCQRKERLALATNPLALSMMIDLFATRHYHFPNDRRMLYDTYIDYIDSKNRQFVRGRSRVKLQLSDLKKAWKSLANAMMLAEEFSLTIEKKWAIKNCIYRDSQRISPYPNRGQPLRDGVNLGLFLEDVESGTVRFFHQTLYEHFAMQVIDIGSGAMSKQVKVVQRLENLGQIALPTLPTLIDVYFTQTENNDIQLYNACKAAAISMSLEVGTPEGVYFSLSIMLQSALRLYRVIAARSEEPSSSHRSLQSELADGLTSNFRTALDKAFLDVLVKTRKEDLSSAFRSLGSRFQDETDALARELCGQTVIDIDQQRVSQTFINPRDAEWLAGANADALKAAQDTAMRLKKFAKTNLEDAAQLVIALSEARSLMEGEAEDATNATVDSILRKERELRESIIRTSHRLSGIDPSAQR